MKCDVCSQEATVFLTQIINGQMTNVNLCETCSKEKGVTDTMGFGLAEAFLSPAQARASEELVCNTCGFTQSQLKKIGRMGCPECYSTFRDGLDGLLKAMHKDTRHIGKVPHGRAVVGVELQRHLAQLREHLSKAVAEERYEEAARFKNEIESLQRQSAVSAS
jgi:protein arginine kinase activator